MLPFAFYKNGPIVSILKLLQKSRKKKGNSKCYFQILHRIEAYFVMLILIFQLCSVLIAHSLTSAPQSVLPCCLQIFMCLTLSAPFPSPTKNRLKCPEGEVCPINVLISTITLRMSWILGASMYEMNVNGTLFESLWNYDSFYFPTFLDHTCGWEWSWAGVTDFFCKEPGSKYFRLGQQPLNSASIARIHHRQ